MASTRPSRKPVDDDPLDGYRGRMLSEYESVENEVRQFHSMMASDVDLSAMRDVIRADDLIRELNNESSTFKRLVAAATAKLDEACLRWQSEPDPHSVAAVNAHGDARAARLLLNWVQQTIEIGAQSEKQLQSEVTDD